MDIKIIFPILISVLSETKTDRFAQFNLQRDIGSTKVARWESRSLSKHRSLDLTSTFIKPKPQTVITFLKVHLTGNVSNSHT